MGRDFEGRTGPEPGPVARAVTAGLLALSGAGAGAAAGGSGAAMVVAAGAAALTPYGERLAALVGAELGGKPQLLADATLDGARGVDPGISEDRLADVLVADDEVRALLFRVLDAVRRTAREDKLRGLGLILGQVAADPHRLDDGRLIVAALDDLEAPQLATLRVLVDETPPVPAERRGWLDEEIEHHTGLSTGAVLASLGTLTRHGLAQTLSGFGGIDSYRPTDLGRAVLAAIGRHIPTAD